MEEARKRAWELLAEARRSRPSRPEQTPRPREWYGGWKDPLPLPGVVNSGPPRRLIVQRPESNLVHMVLRPHGGPGDTDWRGRHPAPGFPGPGGPAEEADKV